MKDVKYSIIIPVNNEINHLPEVITSIITQEYDDYELIISDDSSIDGTAEYIDTLKHPNIKAIHTTKKLTVTEHFDWAQTHASGQWQMFLGGDDGLQPYFFKLADRLTEIAARKNIRTIASWRAYFFWNGCQSNYGDIAVSYNARYIFKIKNSKKEMYKALKENDDGCGYFDLPQMYTTSLFHSSLIGELRAKQEGQFVTYGVTDANMAALSITSEKNFLYSYMPLGWVGTSPKVLVRTDDFIDENLDIHIRCGNYRLGSLSVYFWGALLTLNTYDIALKRKLESKKFVLKITAHLWNKLRKQKNFKNSNQYKHFLQFLELNNCTLREIIKKAKFINIIQKLKKILIRIYVFPLRCIRYILRRIPFTKVYFSNKKIHNPGLHITWKEQPDMSMQKASSLVNELINLDVNL